MEAFFQENRDSYIKQVATFQPSQDQAQCAGCESGEEDTSIGVRVRPLLPNEIEDSEVVGISVRPEAGYADVHELRRKINGQPTLNSSSFRLDKVYGPDRTSEDVYHGLVAPLVPWAWGGGISTLFAYGQTGSGKTYSVSELERLAAAELMNGNLEGNRDVYICAFELVGKEAFDLLNDRRKIVVMEDAFGESQLVGAVEEKPSTAEELLSHIERSMSFRKTAPTSKNDRSSRSHAVCRIRIANKDVIDAPDGQLFLVDLAGSEVDRDIKEHSRDRMMETRDINVSLSTLKDCIRGRAMWNMTDGVAANKRAMNVHVPFRSSVLTKVLKHVFDVKGDRYCKTTVLACVKPNAADAGPSKNTLRYAELLRVPVPKIKPASYNVNIPSTWSHHALMEWIERNSGSPTISSSLLAPTENGTQLCKLPKGEFVSRCLKTPNVSPEHARAFYDKLWRLHIDSRTARSATPSEVSSAIASEDKASPKPNVPFQERLQPGMIVRVKRRLRTDFVQHAMILCPEGAFEKDAVNREEMMGKKRYVCAQIFGAVMADAYNLAMEAKKVIAAEDMEAEVSMEWDAPTRYWFMTI
ncbi:related to kinesin-related protein KLPA [Phialocephala subalpina]|uniref:Kinesin-like protein n=1 Tax=Phialocephala subalpina TaxID=576137 RepID=A0A1L7XPX3_9HELO|nr:related to kinesin-related protein KLPA [Phialocephala subalpina]